MKAIFGMGVVRELTLRASIVYRYRRSRTAWVVTIGIALGRRTPRLKLYPPLTGEEKGGGFATILEEALVPLT
ncbi:hypothetical protein [Erythrobacter sp.]|uniref:hypothetical protein n=1 Tax=Erythrobacter sp. TaxID=1042 RepID=UPI002E9A053C|nr:hypothetical protein [Erythrobacter sp.]